MRRSTMRKYWASVEALWRMARELGHTPSQREYDRLRPRESTVGRYTIEQTHDGWAAFLEAANLEPHRRSGPIPRKRPETCECGKPVAHTLQVRIRDADEVLYLCEDCYERETS